MEDAAKWIVASAAIPFFFPPSEIGTRTLVDGGALSNLDLSEAIVKCNDLGYKDEDIIVDMLMCFDKNIAWDSWSMNNAKYKNAYELYQRKESLRMFYYYYEDITRVVRGYPNVHFRHLMSPMENLHGTYVPIFDDIEKSRGYINRGYIDTTKALEWYFKKFPHHSVNFTGNSTDSKP